MKETLDEQSRQSLIKYRINRADETVMESKLLAKEGFYNAAMNRLYYACYYAARAILIAYHVEAKTHEGVRQQLGLNFVVTGKIPNFVMVKGDPAEVVDEDVYWKS